MRPSHRSAAALCIFAALAACGGNRVADGPGSKRMRTPPPDAVPRPEARSKYGNGPHYEVFGTRYTVMPSSAGYQERGVASWYGKKFHGNLTSNREVYDMYAMTAAHKSLPLPTYVQVRNLRNNRTVVVRVNDRGPFIHNRLIDLSYAAALKLDMIRDGTSLVEVKAISFDAPRGERTVRAVTPPELTEAPVGAGKDAADNRIFVQVGAFGERGNATRRLALLQQSGIRDAYLYEDRVRGNALYRVRIGPIAGAEQYDALVARLGAIGVTDPYLITD